MQTNSGTFQGQSISTDECPVCHGTGYTVTRWEDGELRYRECECSIRKRNMKRIEKSGLKDLLERCTLERFTTAEPWQKAAKEAAERYLTDWREKWFYIGGSSGSGKTHLCTAMCGKLIDAGMPVRYVQWRSDVPKIKAKAKDAEAYTNAIEPLKNVRVLYIDDFLKGGVTDADRNLAFDLLNARYIKPNCITLISSEWTLDRVLSWDEAIGSRISERAKSNTVNITGSKNYRLRGAR